MKEILGKCTTKSSTLLTKVTVHKNDIFDAKKQKQKNKNQLLINSIKFLQTDLGTDLANKITNSSNPFNSYIAKTNTSIESQLISTDLNRS